MKSPAVVLSTSWKRLSRVFGFGVIKIIPGCPIGAIRDLFIQKQPAMPWDQNPEQSNGNYSENEQKGKQKWREGGGEAGGKREREKEEENEKELEDEQEKKGKREKKQCPKGRLVSKSLMDAFWAKFKLNRCPTIQESLLLSFEFGMTHKQMEAL
ncbi:NANOG neighbor homeobox-like isoform X2 [Pongo abelii]|uniref:NANOG neighbor homeobox-like isoform X2 n=1 Tax=Pongo abelii TaxID=9601 RepID=UPI0023E868B5|nr:NANOG neighbor homeobox-like isoform X2 [Pongo abelii]